MTQRKIPSIAIMSLAVMMMVPTAYPQNQPPRRQIGVVVQTAFLVRSVPRRAKTVLQPGDLILKIDGHQFSTTDEFWAFARTGEAPFSLQRSEGGKAQPKLFNTTAPRRLTGDLVFVVLEVSPGSPADQAGIVPWAIITRLNGHSFASVDEFRSRIQEEGELEFETGSLDRPHQLFTVKIKPQSEQ